MASSSGNSSGGTTTTTTTTSSGATTGEQLRRSSSSEEDFQQPIVVDERKRKRMESNRESARRSRLRKQKLQEDLASQVADLKRENNQILSAMSVTTQQCLNVEAENSVLRAQMAELGNRLDSLNEILNCINSSSSSSVGYGGGGVVGPAPGAEMMMMMMGGGGDGFVGSPWNSGWMMNQPITASSVEHHHDFGY